MHARRGTARTNTKPAALFLAADSAILQAMERASPTMHEHAHDHDAPPPDDTHSTEPADESSGAAAARQPDMFVVSVLALLGLAGLICVSLLGVGAAKLLERWVALPSAQVLLVFCSLLGLLVFCILTTAAWRSLRTLHERLLTLAEQQQAMLLLLARHTGVPIEPRAERTAGPRRPRMGRR
jgi:hypothetical protein